MAMEPCRKRKRIFFIITKSIDFQQIFPMAQKELVKKVFFWIVLSLNIIAAFLLLLSWLAGLVHPSISRLVVFCGLGFPYLLLVNIAFVLAWLFIGSLTYLEPPLCAWHYVNTGTKGVYTECLSFGKSLNSQEWVSKVMLLLCIDGLL